MKSEKEKGKIQNAVLTTQFHIFSLLFPVNSDSDTYLIPPPTFLHRSYQDSPALFPLSVGLRRRKLALDVTPPGSPSPRLDRRTGTAPPAAVAASDERDDDVDEADDATDNGVQDIADRGHYRCEAVSDGSEGRPDLVFWSVHRLFVMKIGWRCRGHGGVKTYAGHDTTHSDGLTRVLFSRCRCEEVCRSVLEFVKVCVLLSKYLDVEDGQQLQPNTGARLCLYISNYIGGQVQK